MFENSKSSSSSPNVHTPNALNQNDHTKDMSSYRVQNLFEITCIETPINNNLVQKTIHRTLTTTTNITHRRRSNLFQNNENPHILIDETPTPMLNRKKNIWIKKTSVAKKKNKSSASKPKTPVLRLPPSASGHSSGSKKIKKLLSKEKLSNDENLAEISPTVSQTTPSKKVSSIFKPKSKLNNEDQDSDGQDHFGCDLSFDSLKKQERRGRNNQLVIRLSEIFSSIEIEDDQPKQITTNNNNNLLEINPSPIVIHRSVPIDMESTKISSTILSSTKNSNSLTHVTYDTVNRNEETSRFEYTGMNSYGNGSVHLNANNQFVILDTQFPPRKSLLAKNYDEEEGDHEKDLTRVTTFNDKPNKTKSTSVLTDKTNSLLSHPNKNAKQKDLKTTVSRYSYCSEVDIEEVNIPESHRAYDDSDDDENSELTAHFPTRHTKEKVNSKQNKSIKDKTRFGSTQSPVVITKTSSYFSKSIKHTVSNEMSDCPTTSNETTTASTNPFAPRSHSTSHEITTASTNPFAPPSHSTTQEQSARSTNSSRITVKTNVDNAQPAIRIIELTLDSSSSTTEINAQFIEQTKKAKKLLHVNKLLNDDDTLPGSSNGSCNSSSNKNEIPKKKFSSIFKPKKAIALNDANSHQTKKKPENLDLMPSASPIESENNSNQDANINSQEKNSNLIFNLTQEDLEFIFEDQQVDTNSNQQRIVSSRSSSKFSSTRNGSIIEKTTTVTKAVATTSRAVMPARPKQVARKQAHNNKNNQVVLSHFDLNSIVDSLNSTFTLTTEKKYNLIFKIGEEIADHVCQLNDRQFYDKTKILCLIKELIAKDVNFIPSILNPRLKFVSNPEEEEDCSFTDRSSFDSDTSERDDANRMCNKCNQKNKLLTEVCVQCRLTYHKKCEKIKYIPVNGWICSKCKSLKKT